MNNERLDPWPPRLRGALKDADNELDCLEQAAARCCR